MASAHSGDARTFPLLARLTESSDPDVRYQVAQAVGAVADAATKDTAVRLLRLLAADAEEGVQAEAMETLRDGDTARRARLAARDLSALPARTE